MPFDSPESDIARAAVKREMYQPNYNPVHIGGEPPQRVALDLIRGGLERFQQNEYAAIPYVWVRNAFASWSDHFAAQQTHPAGEHSRHDVQMYTAAVFDEIHRLVYPI